MGAAHVSGRARRRSHRAGPIFSTVYFSLLALHWIALGTVGLYYLRPHPLSDADYFVGGLCVIMGLFYFWVGYAVYKRRAYIWNIAVACAGIWLLGIPSGTVISLLLISNLIAARHSFTR